MSATMYHYIIARRDLPSGDNLAQTTHAAGESAAAWALANGQLLPYGTHAVHLEARDESQLLDLAYRLERAGIPHIVIREPDAPYNGEATAIGVLPTAERTQLRRICGSLRCSGDGAEGRKDHGKDRVGNRAVEGGQAGEARGAA